MSWSRRTVGGAFENWVRHTMQSRQDDTTAAARARIEAAEAHARDALRKAALRRLESVAVSYVRGSLEGALMVWHRAVQSTKEGEAARQRALSRLSSVAVSWSRRTVGGAFENWVRHTMQSRQDDTTAAARARIEAAEAHAREALRKAALRRLESVAVSYVRGSLEGALVVWHRAVQSTKEGEAARQRALSRLSSVAVSWSRRTVGGAFENWVRHTMQSRQEDTTAAARARIEAAEAHARDALRKAALRRLESVAVSYVRGSLEGAFWVWHREVQATKDVEAARSAA